MRLDIICFRLGLNFSSFEVGEVDFDGIKHQFIFTFLSPYLYDLVVTYIQVRFDGKIAGGIDFDFRAHVLVFHSLFCECY